MTPKHWRWTRDEPLFDDSKSPLGDVVILVATGITIALMVLAYYLAR
ncbi:hypothetical protein [Rhodococcus sp. SMB37]|nr:hypothetical protein [Rhodococcus sp. SMB37]